MSVLADDDNGDYEKFIKRAYEVPSKSTNDQCKSLDNDDSDDYEESKPPVHH